MASSFPTTRLRRNRRDAWSRALVRQAGLSPADLIWPMFVQEDDMAGDPSTGRTAVPSMPGVERVTVAALLEQVAEAVSLHIPAVALFPQTADDAKTEGAEEAYSADNLVNRSVRAIRARFSPDEIGVICDVALDPYSLSGHDGLVDETGLVLNDETVAVLVKQAVSHAEAGCDVIAPSDMMDGRVAAIRGALDAAGFQHVRIMAYSAKYCSAFYGPFRDAVGSGAVGAAKRDKSNYQMDPGNLSEALREVEFDVAEGADMVMVKPGMPYLDVVHAVRAAHPAIPVMAYQVSGEYAMLQAAAQNGWLDYDKAMMEVCVCVCACVCALSLPLPASPTHQLHSSASNGRRGVCCPTMPFLLCACLPTCLPVLCRSADAPPS
jgi:porphobilinogen synthase